MGVTSRINCLVGQHDRLSCVESDLVPLAGEVQNVAPRWHDIHDGIVKDPATHRGALADIFPESEPHKFLAERLRIFTVIDHIDHHVHVFGLAGVNRPPRRDEELGHRATQEHSAVEQRSQTIDDSHEHHEVV